MKNIIKTILNVIAIAIVSVWFIATIWACGYQSAKDEQKAVAVKETASTTDSCVPDTLTTADELKASWACLDAKVDSLIGIKEKLIESIPAGEK